MMTGSTKLAPKESIISWPRRQCYVQILFIYVPGIMRLEVLLRTEVAIDCAGFELCY
jgi:hypothetical protein